MNRKLKIGDRVQFQGTTMSISGTVNGEATLFERNRELSGYIILLDRANYLRDMSLFVRTVFASSEDLTPVEA